MAAKAIRLTSSEERRTEFYLLVIHGDVEPELRGPFDRAHLRDEAARQHRRGDPAKEDGLYRLDVFDSGVPAVQAYGACELEDSNEESEVR